MIDLNHFYGFSRDPFPQKVKIDELYMLPGLDALVQRFTFALKAGAVSIITGDVGSGKSTSLRFACSKLHPSQYKIIPIVATAGSMTELLRQVLLFFGIEYKSTQTAIITKMVRDIILDTASRKTVPLLVIDESHLMKPDVFCQLHTLGQFDFDSKPVLPIVLCGQDKLLDRLLHPAARPLASRIIGRTYMSGLNLEAMKGYLEHHLKLAGSRENLFSDEAVLAIHQGSGGLLRRSNILARGALLAAALEKCQVISAEHVRLATTEVM